MIKIPAAAIKISFDVGLNQSHVIITVRIALNMHILLIKLHFAAGNVLLMILIKINN